MKTKTWLALLAALALLALAAVAAGCGDDGDDRRTSSAAGNGTDAAFITDMTAHHEGAIEMARIAQKRAEHPEIRRLADAIVDAQQGEISVMQAMRRDMHGMAQHGAGHMGMSDAQMGMDMNPAELNHAKPFDRAFMAAMVPHHQGAIAMARKLLEKGEQPALRKMAQHMIDAQTKEIAQMRKWHEAWYGAGSGMDMGG